MNTTLRILRALWNLNTTTPHFVTSAADTYKCGQNAGRYTGHDDALEAAVKSLTYDQVILLISELTRPGASRQDIMIAYYLEDMSE